MAISVSYDLDEEISKLIRTDEKCDYRAGFKRGLQMYIESRQKKTAMKILERIYNNDRTALRHDMESGEREKILMMIRKDTFVEAVERKKMLAVLYPMFKEKFSSFLRMWGD